MLYCVTIFAIVAAGLWFVAGSNPTNAVANNAANSVILQAATVFSNPAAIAPADRTSNSAGTNPGIPPSNYPSPIVVSGLIGTVSKVTVTFSITSTFPDDFDILLVGPTGARSLVMSDAGGSGDPNNVSYTWDQTAALMPDGPTTIVPTGTYRPSNYVGLATPEPGGQDNFPAPGPGLLSYTTDFNVFNGTAPNGTWNLYVVDDQQIDTMSLPGGWSIDVTTTNVTPDDAPLDMNGDGLTDFVIVRNTGGGPGGQITWMTNLNGIGPIQGAQWGLQGDEFVPADYDGDDKDDIAVWRPLPGTGSTWFILNSATQTARVEQYGLSTDDPSVVDDYDGDNKADLAVYRSGTVSCPTPGCESNWFYRTTAGGPITTIRWGQNGDFPVPGDFNGDGKADFCVQRNAGGGQGRFFVGYNAGGTLPPVVQPSFIFGTPTDVILPGDYDGDDKTDICVVRGIGGQINWFYHPSDGSADVLYQAFGVSATDFPTPGDYDGDGRIDLAVWRPDIDPTQTFFFFRKTTNGAINQFEWGQNGDYPPANYNNH